jgi:hypothetical protein
MTEPLLDRYFDPDDPDYTESSLMIHREETIMGQNPTAVQLASLPPVLLWRALAPAHIEDSAVKGLYYEADGTLCGVCGEKARYFFTIRDGKLISIVPAEKADPQKIKKALCRELPELNFTDALPHYPGRQYKAAPVAAAKLADGQTLVGTLDGMLALIKDGRAYGLGPAAFNGPVHAMAATPDGNKIYGVAGDEEDLAVLFSYDESSGLRWLGFIENGVTPEISSVFCCTYVRSCAISPDGKYLAVGADERIGTVVIYRI